MLDSLVMNKVKNSSSPPVEKINLSSNGSTSWMLKQHSSQQKLLKMITKHLLRMPTIMAVKHLTMAALVSVVTMNSLKLQWTKAIKEAASMFGEGRLMPVHLMTSYLRERWARLLTITLP